LLNAVLEVVEDEICSRVVESEEVLVVDLEPVPSTTELEDGLSGLGAVHMCTILCTNCIQAVELSDSLSETNCNGRFSDKWRRLLRYQRAQAHNSTLYRRQHSFMNWLCSKQNCLRKWGETKQRSENQVAFNSVLGPSLQHKNS
jgi:hypothetical protein